LRFFHLFLLAGLAGICSGPRPAFSQERAFAFEIRGGGALPLSSFRSGEDRWAGEAGASTAFGMGFTLPGPGPFGAFLGFGQRRFECMEPVCPRGSEWVSTGFDVALRLVLGHARVRPWLRGGLHNHRFEGRIWEGEGEAVEIHSDGGGGFEVGGGVLIAIGPRTSLSPGLHYGWGEVPFPQRRAMRLRYLVMDMGVVFGF